MFSLVLGVFAYKASRVWNRSNGLSFFIVVFRQGRAMLRDLCGILSAHEHVHPHISRACPSLFACRMNSVFLLLLFPFPPANETAVALIPSGRRCHDESRSFF